MAKKNIFSGIKNFDLKLLLVFAVVVLVAVLSFDRISNPPVEVQTPSSEFNDTNGNGIYDFNEFTRVDVCISGCNTMGNIYQSNLGISSHKGSPDVQDVIRRQDTCYEICGKTFN